MHRVLKFKTAPSAPPGPVFMGTPLRDWMGILLTKNVSMKPLLLALFLLSFAACSSARAQVVPSANGSEFQLTVGALGSVLQPDFSYSNFIGTPPNRVYGVGTYIDFRLSRWIQPEAEARWSEFNTAGEGNREDTYLGGLRVPIHVFHKMHATPYGKFLIGWGRGSGFLNPPSTLAMAYGGGLDLRVTKRITLRAIDFEYQQWRVKPTLFPYEGSVGLSYRIF
jgi:opacity protein-like surface antigen